MAVTGALTVTRANGIACAVAVTRTDRITGADIFARAHFVAGAFGSADRVTSAYGITATVVAGIRQQHGIALLRPRFHRESRFSVVFPRAKLNNPVDLRFPGVAAFAPT
jgi:hypothetical protein